MCWNLFNANSFSCVNLPTSVLHFRTKLSKPTNSTTATLYKLLKYLSLSISLLWSSIWLQENRYRLSGAFSTSTTLWTGLTFCFFSASFSGSSALASELLFCFSEAAGASFYASTSAFTMFLLLFSSVTVCPSIIIPLQQCLLLPGSSQFFFHSYSY